MSVEEEARRICHQLLCGSKDLSLLQEMTNDPALAEEVHRRLDAVGLQVKSARGFGRLAVIGDPALRDGTTGHDLNEPQLAALAFLLFSLQIAPEPTSGDDPTMEVQTFAQRFGKQRGWKVDYVRRSVLGPLAKAEYVRLVTPGGRLTDQYIAPGPRMALLDRATLVQRLGRMRDAEVAAQQQERDQETAA